MMIEPGRQAQDSPGRTVNRRGVGQGDAGMAAQYVNGLVLGLVAVLLRLAARRDLAQHHFKTRAEGPVAQAHVDRAGMPGRGVFCQIVLMLNAGTGPGGR